MNTIIFNSLQLSYFSLFEKIFSKKNLFCFEHEFIYFFEDVLWIELYIYFWTYIECNLIKKLPKKIIVLFKKICETFIYYIYVQYIYFLCIYIYLYTYLYICKYI